MYIVYDEKTFEVSCVYHNQYPELTDGGVGLFIEGELPQAEYVPRMEAMLKIDTEKAELYYDYKKPDTVENRVRELQAENAALLLQMAGLDASGQQLTQDHATLLLQLAEKGVI